MWVPWPRAWSLPPRRGKVRMGVSRRGATDPLSRWERVKVRALVGRAAKEGTRRRRWLATVSGRGVVACTKEILGSPGTGCQS